MAKHTQLSILESKLKKIRIYRHISQILAAILGFVVAAIMMRYLDPFFSPFIGFIIIFASYQLLRRYYNKKEKQVIWQIHELRLRKGYSEN